MRKLRKGLLLAVCAALAAASVAQDAKPKEVLASITEIQRTRMAQAREAGRPVDVAAMQAEMKAKAEEAIKNVDVDKVAAADGYDWAQIFSMAGNHAGACRLAERYLATNPADQPKFDAQILMLRSCNEMGEGDRIAEVLPTVKAPTPAAGTALSNYTINFFADTIAAKKGVDAALKALDEVEKGVPVEDPAVVAKRMFDAQVARRKAANQADMTKEEADRLMATYEANAKNAPLVTKVNFAKKRAELLIAANRKPEAVKILDDAIAQLPEGSPARRTANSERIKLTQAGTPAPEFEVERTIGEYKGLSAYKGKVVLLKFFAHW